MINSCIHDNIFSNFIIKKQYSEIIYVYYSIRIFRYYQTFKVVLKYNSTTPKKTKQQSKTNILHLIWLLYHARRYILCSKFSVRNVLKSIK